MYNRVNISLATNELDSSSQTFYTKYHLRKYLALQVPPNAIIKWCFCVPLEGATDWEKLCYNTFISSIQLISYRLNFGTNTFVPPLDAEHLWGWMELGACLGRPGCWASSRRSEDLSKSCFYWQLSWTIHHHLMSESSVPSWIFEQSP